MSVRRVVQVAVSAVVVALLLGRWLAVTTADGLWAEALGVAATHAQIRRVQTLLWVTAFLSAAVWCVGNLYLVYRSIRSVHVPRQLGNLEILEAVPRRFLRYAVVGLGVLLAIAVSHNAVDWWQVRALTEYRAPVGIADPILGRDLGFYLFRLPWHRTIHGFAALLVGIMLVMVAALYATMGAVRWSQRRLQITDLARWHLAGLLVALALVLFWGYRLEPAEYVAGIHTAAADVVLATVRIPVARLLSVAALIAAGCSLAWFRSRRVLVVGVPWGLLAVLSLTGHYVVPSFATAVRSADELVLASVEAERSSFTALAYGTTYLETSLDPAAAEPGVLPTPAAVFAEAPVWDAFAVTLLLDRVAVPEPFVRFTDASLGVYRSQDGVTTPAYVAVRRVDLQTAGDTTHSVGWEGVHAGPYAFAEGAVAVDARRVTTYGLPVFVSDLSRPGEAEPEVRDVVLDLRRVLCAPGIQDFALVGADPSVLGSPVGGFWRRLAFAWTLQSPRFLTAAAIRDTSVLVWRRDVVERLDRFAPFATFGEPRAIAVEGELYWIANGYVSADAFPVAPAHRWRGDTRRYLRSSLVGVVAAASGETAVYLTRDADPVSIAWAQVTPQLVRPASQLPRGLLPNIPYPAELLSIQLDVIRAMMFPPSSTERSDQSAVMRTAGQDPYWWVGATGADSVARLRLLATLERRDSGALAAIVEGSMRDATPVLQVFVADGPGELPGASQAARRISQLRGEIAAVDGVVRMIPYAGGVAWLQSAYASTASGDAPQLVDVAIGFDGALGNGPTLDDAVERLGAGASLGGQGSQAWSQARHWFARMDSARRLGDWGTFGRAYEELRRLLVGARDSVR
jgi:uncharacterized membrane protein (UPF0182 family)